MAKKPKKKAHPSRRRLVAGRHATMGDLAHIFETIYGPRCSVNEGGCLCCAAWAIYDLVDKLTDSSLLD